MSESLLARRARTGTPIVLMHMGETKTGTTFLQETMWANRALLSGHGVELPGFVHGDHYRAVRDLRGGRYDESDPRGSWAGEWDVLAAQAAGTRSVAVISQEGIVAASHAAAKRAVASLAPAEVHLALTVRDLASLLPAEWQENVKNGSTWEWLPWLETVLDRGSHTPSPLRRGFWRQHGTLEALKRWTEFVAPERIHVVTVPPSGSPPGLLWERWTSLLGMPATGADLTAARSNTSLTYVETEFLRQVNEGVKPRVPKWFYEGEVKGFFAQGVLPARGDKSRPPLTEAAARRATGYAERITAGLVELGVDVVGDLADLQPRRLRTDGESEVPAAALATTGVRVVTDLLASHFERPVDTRRTPQRNATGRERLLFRLTGSPRIRRMVRDLTGRSASLRRARVLVWRFVRLGRRDPR